MSKIPLELENPIDKIIIRGCEILTPKIRSLNIYILPDYSTKVIPNHITTFSFFTGLYSINMLSCGFPKISVIFLFISYFFDCLDGFYARSYGMVTVFGDYYDHITDWVINIGYMWVLCRHQQPLVVTSLVCILVPLLVIQMIHLSAVEKYYDNLNESKSLVFVKKIINNIDSRKKSVKCLNWSKYFGCGTYYMVLILITLVISPV